ncbi:hypothetical protein ACTWPB_11505 [Nocardia sp. IBHARD005]|uniref:hypothetical protein n=1 Tax=Nocardia sp. IBHARD005 TaxID=3457765 RepID=UPI00405A3F5F
MHFVDGSAARYDTIVWATGYEVGFPFLDEALLRWDNGNPVLLDHLLPPGLANLYLFGLLKPLGGAGRLIGDGADVVVGLVRAQEDVPVPLSDLAAGVLPQTSSMLVGISQMMRVFDRAHAFTDAVTLLPSSMYANIPTALRRPGLSAFAAPRWTARTVNELLSLAGAGVRAVQRRSPQPRPVPVTADRKD